MEHEAWKAAVTLRNEINEIIDALNPGKEINWSEINQTFQSVKPLYEDLNNKIWAGFSQ